ncbi:MAG TPA: hypothetical protein VGK37_04135 [Casimicrobiaceae bacterium]|jgi:hypothetical protein
MIKCVAKFVLTLIFGLTLAGAANAQNTCPACNWALVEVYSNADGSVQFLVMYNGLGGAGVLVGQTLVASNDSTENSFRFPANPPDSAGRWVLVGTQGFADLHLVTPDFIVPNSFFSVRNGTVQLRPDNWYASTVRYAALPTDGVKALYPDAYGDGSTYTATAQAANSAGQSYIFPVAEKFSGLWWNAPSGSESGWGLAVDHQGETLFAAWATYDTDGSPTWFVMPGAKQSGDPSFYFGYPNTYLGPIYRTTGPAFNLPSFDPSAVTITQVGSGVIHFSTIPDDIAYNNGDNSMFSFTIGGFQTPQHPIVKYITRQVFAGPVSVCVAGAAPGPAPNFQGMWWNPSESGWGLHLTHQSDIVYAVWFTYDATGNATWLVMSTSKTAPNTYSGAIYRTTGPAFTAPVFNPGAMTATQVGTGTLTFGDRGNGIFSYVVGGVAQTKTITRQIFADPPTVCN